MILITIVTEAYKPTNITGGAHIVEMMVNAGFYAGHGNLWKTTPVQVLQVAKPVSDSGIAMHRCAPGN